jgi:hypothetical protein
MTYISPDELSAKAQSVNLIASFDVSGRGGNIFFLSIFDRHPAVAGCALVQYTYSYADTQFGDTQTIDATAAHAFITDKAYTRLLYHEPTSTVGDMISRLGGDLGARFDRAAFRRMIDDYFTSRQTISRRDLITVPMLAYAAALGRDLEPVRYVIMGDAISMRHEQAVQGFSGRMVDVVLKDFPDAKIVRLIRDPRATFASPRHQFVNCFGNMYAIGPGLYFSRLWDLVRANLTMENGSVYLYWLIYIKQAEIAGRRKLRQHPGNFLTVINEELNTNFPVAMAKLAKWLDISFEPDWSSNAFVPTVMDAPWLGTGAYNNRYQRAVHGPLANDPDDVAGKVTGPNEYVTRRWRSRLGPREIELIEHLFRQETAEYGYEVLQDRPETSDLGSLLRTALLPFVGEMPTWNWLKTGWSLGAGEFGKRLFYTVTFPPFYVISRVVLFDFVLRRRLFATDTEMKAKS